ncbi:unnamed protein product [Menidia menidia]|uniref:(Atlantic silverside) hypothetical protein n=1 Tax=Menidia menidia TaxID=238744 RepID=A0A8S4AC47_9TELE|nr:unnamed protein product [Menidia menidia]
MERKSLRRDHREAEDRRKNPNLNSNHGGFFGHLEDEEQRELRRAAESYGEEKEREEGGMEGWRDGGMDRWRERA